jgi:hypothetical protein
MLFADMIILSIFIFTSSLTLPKLQVNLSNILLQKQSSANTCLFGFKPPSLTGIQTPIRLNRNYEIECLSLNGKDCVWNTIVNGEDCHKFTIENQSRLQPLACGAMSMAIHGTEGFGNGKHWCEQGRQWFFNRWHCSDETGLAASIRVDLFTNNVECLSSNGKDCILNDVNACKSANSDTRPPVSVVCGEKNIHLFNHINPYYDPQHNWCKQGNVYLFGESQWICGGDVSEFNVPFRYNQFGDIECYSTDGRNCAWGNGKGSQCVQFMNNNARNLNPLKCGGMTKALYGTDGYSIKGHWCRVLMDKFILTTRLNLN